MTTNTSLALHFLGLDTKESALFNRVISFSAKHGLVTNNVDDIAQADLIIADARSFASIEQTAVGKATILVSNDDSVTQGDYQIVRPLMITKVMGTLTEAIELAKTKKASAQATPIANTDNELVNINIEDASVAVVEELVQEKNTESNSETSIESITEPTSSALHALVIDDSAAIRKQLELELRDAGITAEFAESGEEALEIIKDKHFDLVFLDIIMPGMDGYETCKVMRTNAAYKKTPIVMLSGKTSPLDEVQGVIAGATTYLTKPVKSDKLQETLNRLTKWIKNYASKDTKTA